MDMYLRCFHHQVLRHHTARDSCNHMHHPQLSPNPCSWFALHLSRWTLKLFSMKFLVQRGSFWLRLDVAPTPHKPPIKLHLMLYGPVITTAGYFIVNCEPMFHQSIPYGLPLLQLLLCNEVVNVI